MEKRSGHDGIEVSESLPTRASALLIIFHPLLIKRAKAPKSDEVCIAEKAI